MQALALHILIVVNILLLANVRLIGRDTMEVVIVVVDGIILVGGH